MNREQRPDPRSVAAYSLPEAARYVKLPAATLRSWVVGRNYPKADGVAQFEPLITPPKRDPVTLSFWNLIEAHVLRSLRNDHDVSLKNIRTALAYAEKHLHIERLLLSKELCTDGGQVFLDRYGSLIELSASGHLAMRLMLQEHLKRVEWNDSSTFPVRLFPFVTSTPESESKSIVIDRNIQFGRPMVSSRGISTLAITDRIDAGETVHDVAKDYGLQDQEVMEAVMYERAA